LVRKNFLPRSKAAGPLFIIYIGERENKSMNVKQIINLTIEVGVLVMVVWLWGVMAGAGAVFVRELVSRANSTDGVKKKRKVRA
jgi:hypothetical protein